jgi:cyclase
MRRTRVIPALLLRGRDLVKTTSFTDPVYVGDPINTVRLFSEKGADELFVLSIDPGTERPDVSYLAELASECFMPMGYGGGLRTLEQCTAIFDIGMEKVVLRQALVENPGLVSQVAGSFGSQAVCACIDYTGSGHEARQLTTGATLSSAVARAVEAGAGEILLQSVDRDGQMRGYDTVAIGAVAADCPVPLVAMGGAGSHADLAAAQTAGASAVAAGSLFVFHGRRRAVLVSYPDDVELEEVLP